MEIIIHNNSGTAYGATFTTGDIIGVALDLMEQLYFKKWIKTRTQHQVLMVLVL
jgi:uncharacterized membrane protein YoaK (UPF0700 family)